MTSGRNIWEDGEPFSVASLNSLKHSQLGEAVVEGVGDELALSTGAGDFDVDVGSGDVIVDGQIVSFGGGTVNHTGSDTEDRIDLITINSAGAASVVSGTEATDSGQPDAPNLPANEVLAGIVYIRGGSQEILNGDLFDEYKTVISQTFVRDTVDAQTYLENGEPLDRLQDGDNFDGQGTSEFTNLATVENQDYNETVGSATNPSAGVYDLDLTTSNLFSHTLTEATEFTFSNATSTPEGNSFTIMITQDGATEYGITWPSSVEWNGGSAPNGPAVGEQLEVSFISYDGGTTWKGRKSWGS